MEFYLREHEFSRIPTIAAKIRTPPRPIWNLPTVSRGSTITIARHLACEASQSREESQMIRYNQVTVGGNKIFYREAGSATAPTILLLHGFPTSSHMFRNLIPALADRYHVVAPDLPGFGFSDAPDRKSFRYTFENLTKVIDGFTQSIGLQRYAIYVFDYGAP